jgi:ribulose bisphosphate carboxylase small subunit
MNPQQHLELFRDALLRSLKAARSTGMNLFTLEIALRLTGFSCLEHEDVEEQIQYFMDKGFIAEVPKSHSPANKIWRLTAVGMDDLEKRGL